MRLVALATSEFGEAHSSFHLPYSLSDLAGFAVGFFAESSRNSLSISSSEPLLFMALRSASLICCVSAASMSRYEADATRIDMVATLCSSQRHMAKSMRLPDLHRLPVQLAACQALEIETLPVLQRAATAGAPACWHSFCLPGMQPDICRYAALASSAYAEPGSKHVHALERIPTGTAGNDMSQAILKLQNSY